MKPCVVSRPMALTRSMSVEHDDRLDARAARLERQHRLLEIGQFKAVADQRLERVAPTSQHADTGFVLVRAELRTADVDLARDEIGWTHRGALVNRRAANGRHDA